MREVVDLNGNKIGLLNGDKIVGAEGNIIYRISGSEVYLPLEYSEENLKAFNKGQWSLLGALVENKCIANGAVIFSIK
jgi:hypothetical protein